MNKKTKMLLGVGVVAAAAYYFWNKSKKETTPAATASLVGADGVSRRPNPSASGWTRLQTDVAGNVYWTPRGTTYGGM